MIRDPTVAEIRTALIAGARRDFPLFVEFMHRELTGDPFDVQPFHARLFEFLGRVFDGEITRGILVLPPRSGKTSLLQMFLAWAQGHKPDAASILASYGAELAEASSAAVRRIVEHSTYRRIFPEIAIDRAVNARDRWATSARGEFRAVGVGGSITGFGAGRLREVRGWGGAIILDDPLKASEARSEAARAAVGDFYLGSLRSRRNSPETPIIVCAQRLHEDDLIGRLLRGATGERWEALVIPALDSNGASFWPRRFPAGELTALRDSQPWTFHTQYQGEPYATAGTVFKVDAIPIIETTYAGSAQRVRAWDLAATPETAGRDPDYTVGMRLARYEDGRIVVEDVVRLRGRPDEVRAAIRAASERDGQSVRISIPQDPGQAGKSQAQDLAKMLAPRVVDATPESGDKLTRAEPVAAQVNIGNVSVVRAAWTDAFVDELRAFDSGRHDDQVDALSRAFAALAIAKPVPGAGFLEYARRQVAAWQAPT